MKKKFDFSAEIESAEARTNQEYRERYEEENKLLRVNAEELMKLNDNIHEMRTGLEKLANAVQHYEYKIASKTLKQTEKLGNGLIRCGGKLVHVNFDLFKILVVHFSVFHQYYGLTRNKSPHTNAFIGQNRGSKCEQSEHNKPD